MTETTARAYDALSNEPCPGHGDYHCRRCADEEQAVQWMRKRADEMPRRAEDALGILSSLAVAMAEVTGSHFYQEFYRITADDEDAAAHLADARRSLRAFARIARERAARTEQQP
jgi:hypothetical protein